MSSTKTTRRNVLSGATTAILATATPAGASGDDAELIRLGHLLDAALAPWRERIREQDARAGALEQDVFRRTGIRFEDAPERRRVSGTETEPYWRAREAVLDAMPPSPRTDKEEIAFLSEIDGQVLPLACAIAQLPARTDRGLSVKARLLQYLDDEPWRRPEDLANVVDIEGAISILQRQICQEACSIANVRSLEDEVGAFTSAVTARLP
jgi:hypothetical protein